MRVLVLALLVAAPLHAADERKLALEAAAQADFDRVMTAGEPDLASATTCLQSQAMLLSIAMPDETPAIVFRKAYCELARAGVTGTHAAFTQAAESFDDAVADSQAASASQKLPQNVPSAWRILAAVARLNAGASAESQEPSLNAAALDDSDCRMNGTTVEFCHSVHQVASAWLGWMALERGEPVIAARRFSASGAPAWSQWVTGIEAFRRGNYGESAADYGRAIENWRQAPVSLMQRLNPRPDMAAMLTEWGGAELLSGNTAGALATLDAALKTDGSNARALYLRGLAKEREGQNDAALDDYNLASRAAFARTGDAAGAEAHFYRGIVLYRRKEFARAEDEFSSALNADEAAPWRADAQAWRHLAAVAGGACGASREYLGQALASVSPYFPKQEALAAFGACPTTAAALRIK